jgi:hypothetical protein
VDSVFSFNHISTGKGTRYFVYTVDKNGGMHSFGMELVEGSWKITEGIRVADWIWNVEAELGSAIEEQQ